MSAVAQQLTGGIAPSVVGWLLPISISFSRAPISVMVRTWSLSPARPRSACPITSLPMHRRGFGSLGNPPRRFFRTSWRVVRAGVRIYGGGGGR